MSKSIDEIATALMGGLYSLVAKTAGDVDAGSADDPFIAWCKPGIPFEPEDFRFARFGLTGQGATAEEKAGDFAQQLTQAAGFSRFVDFVPSVNGVVAQNVEGGVLRPGAASLSTFYKRVLEASQVAQLPEPAGINEKIAALRQQAAPLKAVYDAGQEQYDAAKVAFVSARLAAGMSAEKQIEFQATGGMLKNKLVKAKQNWEIDGAKTEYENIIAEIDSLRSKRSPAIWRSEALAEYDAVPEGENATFGEARLTMPFPGSFATNTSGWMSFAMKTENVDELSQSKSTKWSAGGGVNWGSFKLGGSASGSTTETMAVTNTDSFSLKLSIAQVPLIRSWFDPWFLRSEFWRFNPSSIEGQNNDVVSDGGMPPAGLIVGYPVAAIFVRDVEISMAELHDESSELVKTLKADASGGWGFAALNLNGSYERNSQVKKHKSNLADGKLTTPGMSLIGFVVEEVGKAPDAKDGLTWVAGSG